MEFISNREPQIREMLRRLRIGSIEELFSEIPESLRCPSPEGEDGLSELEGSRLMEQLAGANTFPQFDSYLGAGAYEHHVPALVGAVCQKSEFLTAYTPYQAEASQGMLQAIFEFQSVVCELTGMDVANASVYDASSACAEGVLMGLRAQRKRSKVVIDEGVHPHHTAVVRQYCQHQGCEIVHGEVDEETAVWLVQNPDFFGTVEDLTDQIERAHQLGALVVVCANPLSYAIYKSAGEMGADVAVGEMQPFGIPLQFGGPYAGYVACREKLVRQIPGRVVGETVDASGEHCYVLTLQAREQHIRREKATSNICSNQALAALASLVGVLWYGPKGVEELAMANYQRAMFLKTALTNLSGVTSPNDSAILNEFVIEFPRPAEQILAGLSEQGIMGGVPLARFYPDQPSRLLVTVTETKSMEQLNRYVAAVQEMVT